MWERSKEIKPPGNRWWMIAEQVTADRVIAEQVTADRVIAEGVIAERVIADRVNLIGTR